MIPPADANVVTPTDSKVEFAVTPFNMSTAAFISKSDAKVETPATVSPSPMFTCFATPSPPLTTKAPFAGAVEFVVLENVAIPVITKVDESIVSVM